MNAARRSILTISLGLLAAALAVLMACAPAWAAQEAEVQSESVVNVSGTSATLEAEIDPHNTPTTYYFQYGPDTAYGNDTSAPPGLLLGSGEEALEASRHVQGLAPGTTYHYRVVAVSEIASGQYSDVDGPDQAFTTQLTGGELTLPDNRQWELVSPPDKHGALLMPITEIGLLQASDTGNAITYLTTAPTESEPPASLQEVQVLSRRGPNGWETHDIDTPHNESSSVSIGYGLEYRAFSSDLSLGLVEPQGPFMSLSPEDSERTVYIRHDETCGSAPTTCYQPLVTGAHGYADVPAGTQFGGSAVLKGEVEFVGATPNFTYSILHSKVGLTSTPGDTGGLYEWSEGALRIVSVLPPSEGGSPVTSPIDAWLGRNYVGSDARHAVSENGTRVVWSYGSEKGHVYLTDPEKGETLKLDAPEPGVTLSSEEEHNGTAQFQIASSDDSRVFFTDEYELTAASKTSQSKSDLYECEITEVAGKLHCDLRDLTPHGLNANEYAGVLGVSAASEDGSYIYFAAAGALAAGAEPGSCEFPSNTTCSLYVYHDGQTKFIAELSAGDSPDWQSTSLNDLTTRATPDGNLLAFMSERPLTGYDNRDAVSGKPDEEVYLYNAVSGHLVCASCNPTGARPDGVEYASGYARLFAGDRVWGSTQWIAANIPGWTPYRPLDALYQSRYLSPSGRLFFNSSDALVPQDVDGTEDVYEYEPAGVGSCTSSSATFSAKSEGCVDLISAGTSAEESGFADASESGSDVFFLTSSSLAPEDVDSARDMYDARECTAQAPCASAPVPPPPCETGDACKAAPTPQPAVFGAPSSETFSGAGNIVPETHGERVAARSLTRAQKLARALRACRGKPHRRRAECERRARRQFSTTKSRKADARKRGHR